MHPLHLLFPKASHALVTGVGLALSPVAGLAVASAFRDTITLGSVIVGAIVVVLAGLFSLLDKRKSFYRGGYHERGEQIEHMQEAAAKAVEEQREIRHELKSELAAAKAALVVAQQRTDLSEVAKQMSAGFEEILKHLAGKALVSEILKMQQQIVDTQLQITARLEAMSIGLGPGGGAT